VLISATRSVSLRFQSASGVNFSILFKLRTFPP
jgi:hypothetical protein